MAGNDDDRPSGFARKQLTFPPEVFDPFQKAVGEMGASPQTLLRKVMTDYLAKRYVNFDAFDEEIKAKLQEKARTISRQGIPGGDQMQTVISIALQEWIVTSKKRG